MFWRAGTEEALGWVSVGEFMRRLPIVYPRGLYSQVRDFIAGRHRDFESYVIDRVNRVKNFSESDVLGEYAWNYMHTAYHWHCLDEVPYEGASAITQFWSRGGLEKPSDRHGGLKPSVVITGILGSL